jgi:hypothetical protein
MSDFTPQPIGCYSRLVNLVFAIAGIAVWYIVARLAGCE